jgi:hypothetical protein
MIRKRVTECLALTALTAALAGCANVKPPSVDPDYMGLGSFSDTYSRPGPPVDNSGLFTFGNAKQKVDQAGAAGAGIGVNAFLWRGALDTLSFLPLSSADPFGGVIITDWYSPADAQGERFKATAYILGRELRSDAIRISVFRQVNQGGRWVDAPVSPLTQADIENKVLDRARKLREQATGNS